MNDLLNLRGRVALITGGASGIGKGAALAFARQGASIGLLGRTDDDELRAAAGEIEALGVEVERLAADVGDPTQVQQAVDKLTMRFGRLDIVFANAGINGVWAPIEEITPEEYDTTMNANLKGTFLTIQSSVPWLKKQGGVVLVTSSVNGTRTFSNTGATVYSTTKAGQVAMAKMLAVELGPYNIRVNVICPGAIQTNINQNTEQRNTEDLGVKVEFPEGTHPLTGEQPGDIHQVGRLALFLASDMADHITGEVVYIDAGSSLVH